MTTKWKLILGRVADLDRLPKREQRRTLVDRQLSGLLAENQLLAKVRPGGQEAPPRQEMLERVIRQATLGYAPEVTPPRATRMYWRPLAIGTAAVLLALFAMFGLMPDTRLGILRQPTAWAALDGTVLHYTMVFEQEYQPTGSANDEHPVSQLRRLTCKWSSSHEGQGPGASGAAKMNLRTIRPYLDHSPYGTVPRFQAFIDVVLFTTDEEQVYDYLQCVKGIPGLNTPDINSGKWCYQFGQPETGYTQQSILLNGKAHQFPRDFTPAEIGQLMSFLDLQPGFARLEVNPHADQQDWLNLGGMVLAECRANYQLVIATWDDETPPELTSPTATLSWSVTFPSDQVPPQEQTVKLLARLKPPDARLELGLYRDHPPSTRLVYTFDLAPDKAARIAGGSATDSTDIQPVPQSQQTFAATIAAWQQSHPELFLLSSVGTEKANEELGWFEISQQDPQATGELLQILADAGFVPTEQFWNLVDSEYSIDIFTASFELLPTPDSRQNEPANNSQGYRVICAFGAGQPGGSAMALNSSHAKVAELTAVCEKILTQNAELRSKVKLSWTATNPTGMACPAERPVTGLQVEIRGDYPELAASFVELLNNVEGLSVPASSAPWVY